MARKKIPRKKLLKEPDEFQTLSARAIEWAGGHRTQLIWTVSIVLFLAAGYAALRFHTARTNAQALALLERNIARYHQVLKSDGAAKAYDAVRPAFEQLLARYGGSTCAQRATLYYANISYAAGKYDQALALYRRQLDGFRDSPLLKNLIRCSVAYAQEAERSYPPAIASFQQILNAPVTSLKDEALFNLALVYAATGDVAKERAALQKIVSQHKDSLYFELAAERIAELK